MLESCCCCCALLSLAQGVEATEMPRHHGCTPAADCSDDRHGAVCTLPLSAHCVEEAVQGCDHGCDQGCCLALRQAASSTPLLDQGCSTAAARSDELQGEFQGELQGSEAALCQGASLCFSEAPPFHAKSTTLALSLRQGACRAGTSPACACADMVEA